jgi:hypothetical protein
LIWIVPLGFFGGASAVASAETIGAPESGLQQAYTGALSWAHELTSVGLGLKSANNEILSSGTTLVCVGARW